MRGSATKTNLIFHHSITNILDHTAEFIDILGAVQEPRDLASSFQRDEVLKNSIELPVKPRTLERLSTSVSMGLPFEGLPPLFLLDFTLGNRTTQ